MRGPRDPLTRQWLARLEQLQDLRRRHRAGGPVKPEEDEIESRELAEIVLFGSEVDEAFAIGQAIQRNGPECGHAQRLMRQRERRREQFVVIRGGRLSAHGPEAA